MLDALRLGKGPVGRPTFPHRKDGAIICVYILPLG